MHPFQYFEEFSALPIEQQVFVIMPFAPAFQERYDEVIKPTIENDLGLKSFRVDARKISDSVIIDILKAIEESVLVLADVSSDSDGIRNANVLYEVGLSHARRPPETVVLVRSDHDPMLFDIANVRVSRYDPDNSSVDASKTLLTVLKSGLREVNMRKFALVQSTLKLLDHQSANFLNSMLFDKGGKYFVHKEDEGKKNILDRIFWPIDRIISNTEKRTRQRIVNRLLDLGLIVTRRPDISAEQLEILDKLGIPKSMDAAVPKDAPDLHIHYVITRLGIEILFAEFGESLRATLTNEEERRKLIEFLDRISPNSEELDERLRRLESMVPGGLGSLPE